MAQHFILYTTFIYGWMDTTIHNYYVRTFTLKPFFLSRWERLFVVDIFVHRHVFITQ